MWWAAGYTIVDFVSGIGWHGLGGGVIEQLQRSGIKMKGRLDERAFGIYGDDTKLNEGGKRFNSWG